MIIKLSMFESHVDKMEVSHLDIVILLIINDLYSDLYL